VIDDGLADDDSPTRTENSSAGFETSTVIRAYDLGLRSGAGQNNKLSAFEPRGLPSRSPFGRGNCAACRLFEFRIERLVFASRH
jgi:hypothetical protein